ncbi:extracellular solute-binding protein [Pengzhenrongella sp.]|jgi:sn-glycerol 3-phosphate transport system substrate-binding protein|uniref:extracellular solute-binding protein n=1 Tax=Pengzhenrongella sp. TaxID=2888820 RepID=UPI002F949CD7
MTTRRHLAGAALLAVTVAALSACGSSSAASRTPDAVAAPGPSALAAATGPVTVTLWHGLGGANGLALQAQIDAFNAANAGKIEVKSVYQGTYEDTLAKYTASIRDRSTPSILVSNDITTGFLHDAGQTVPAQGLAAANPGDLALDDLGPAARNYYSAQGKLLAVPLATSMPLLYVNDALLAKAGVARSSLGTLDGVAAAARAVHAASPSVAGIVQPFDGWWFEQLSAASGHTYCSPGNGRTGAGATSLRLTSDAQRAAIATMASLYTDGVGLNTGADGADAAAAFTAGKVAMMFNSSGTIGGLTEAGLTGYSALPYPLSGPRKSSGALIGGAAMWVDGPGHSAAEQVASWKVISFLASAGAQEKFSQATGYAPVNTGVEDSATEKSFLVAHPNYAVLLKQFGDTPATPATSGCLSGAMTGIRTEVVAQMQSAFGGDVPLDKALDKAEQGADAKIGAYREQAGK